MRPRRGDAGASSSCATCSRAAACPSIATSRPKSAWRTARAAGCGPTSWSGFRAARALVIDAKVSLNDYQDAFGAVDEADRATHLTAHASAIRAHVNTLGAKAYWSQFEDAPDYVVMFIPGEHFLTAALEQDPSFGIMPSTRRCCWRPRPTSSRSRAPSPRFGGRRSWPRRRGRSASSARNSTSASPKAADDLRRVGSGLSTAVNNYNSFVASFESRSLVTARKFRELNIEPGRARDRCPDTGRGAAALR